jgi:hypothetical protein
MAKCAQTVRERVRRCGFEEPDHRHRRLLRARRERPSSCRAAKQRDELAAIHFGHSEAHHSGGLVVDDQVELPLSVRPYLRRGRLPSANDKCLLNSFLNVGHKLLLA